MSKELLDQILLVHPEIKDVYSFDEITEDYAETLNLGYQIFRMCFRSETQLGNTQCEKKVSFKDGVFKRLVSNI